MVWYSHVLKNFPQFVVIHTVKDFGIVKKAREFQKNTYFCFIVIGAMLPMGAKKIGLDPAVMASPFITTIVDTITLVIYFGIASRVLGF